MSNTVKARDAWDEDAAEQAGRPRPYLTAGYAAELQLRRHFMGKRDGVRQHRELDVMLRGRGGSFSARSLDVSRSGILLHITDHLYRQPDDDLASFAGRVDKHFRTRIEVCFVEAGLRFAAEIARLTVSDEAVHGVENTFLLACRFRSALSPAQCGVLGIDGDDDREEA